MAAAGVVLRAARRRAGLSQGELGAGRYSVSYVSRMESGDREMSYDAAAFFEERLALTPGTLASLIDRPDAAARGAARGVDVTTTDAGEAAELVALLQSARAAYLAGEAAPAARMAVEGRDRAAAAVHHDSWWGFSELIVDTSIDSDDYVTATTIADEMVRNTWVQASPRLWAQSCLAAQRAYRMARDVPTSRQHCEQALTLTAGMPATDVRVQALAAAAATGAGDPLAVEAELVDAYRTLTDPQHDPVVASGRLAGLAAWTLGTLGFMRGDVDTGLRWHDRADEALRVTPDIRHWARFARSTVSCRIRAGLDEGVPALIDRAEQALVLLGNHDELADLLRDAALHHEHTGDPTAARHRLDRALALENLPALGKAETLEARARLTQRAGDIHQARTDARDAARLYDRAGRPEQALTAWKLYDSLQ